MLLRIRRLAHEDGTLTVHVGGQVDSETAVVVERALVDGSAATARDLVVDLAAVTVMRTWGVGALRSTLATARARGQGFWIIHAYGAVRESLAVGQLTVTDCGCNQNQVIDVTRQPPGRIRQGRLLPPCWWSINRAAL